MKKIFLISIIFLIISCSTHQKSNFRANEEFGVELKKPASRGLVVDLAFQGIFIGANYLADLSAKPLTNSYSKSISVFDYYNTYNGKIEKTYNKIEIKKYSNPIDKQQKQKAKQIVIDEISMLPKTRDENTLLMNDYIRKEKDDLLNFKAVVELISDPENPGITRLSFNELYILFSKTKVYKDEDLNAKVAISIEGQWRDINGSPMKSKLIEQEFDLKKIKYSAENQIKKPILSQWYYDIPMVSDIPEKSSFGLVKVNIQVVEYEGSKSRYVYKLPNFWNDNKNLIIKDVTPIIEKALK